MKKTMTLQVFADPGHSWARFPLDRLEKLGIADKISAYSYQRGEYVYLEEDCDAAILVKALEEQGYKVGSKVHHTNRYSKIRGYASYRARVVTVEYDPLEDWNYVGSRHHY